MKQSFKRTPSNASFTPKSHVTVMPSSNEHEVSYKSNNFMYGSPFGKLGKKPK